MDQEQKALVSRVISRVPQWVRHDLASKDAVARVRAEETLAAMVINGLESGTAEASES